METILSLLMMLARRMAGLTRRTIVVDAIQWVYLEGGDPSGPPVILVHGFGAEKEHWLRYAAILAKQGYHVICPDLPGFGESDRRPFASTSYSIPAQAARLNDFIDALGLSEDGVHYAGNSMGGYIGLQLALDFPETLQSLTLLDSAGVQGANPSELNAMIDQGETCLLPTTMEEYDKMLTMVSHKPMPVPLPFKKVLLDKAVKHHALLHHIFWDVAESATETPLNDRLHAITTPTLILWGREDRLIDVSCVEVLEREIPNSRAIIYDNVGHVPMMERPGRSASDHSAFIASL
jgi:pimeloyl-ACP methyl ester carboxylesterase